MDSWERFDETSLPDKEAFHSSLHMEDITDVDGITIYPYGYKGWESIQNKDAK